MIEREELRREIDRLEKSEMTYEVCHKLASLYTIYDHAREGTGSSYSSSEFQHVARAAGLDRLLEVMDDHMQEVKYLFPKEYISIIKKLK